MPKTQKGDHREEDDRIDELARQYLALWRDQFVAVAQGRMAKTSLEGLYSLVGADSAKLAEGFEAWMKYVSAFASGQGFPASQGDWFQEKNRPQKAAETDMSGGKVHNTKMPDAMSDDKIRHVNNPVLPEMSQDRQEPDGDDRDAETVGRQKNKCEKGRASASSSSSRNRDDQLADLARRIADLSTTIDALGARSEGEGRQSDAGDGEISS